MSCAEHVATVLGFWRMCNEPKVDCMGVGKVGRWHSLGRSAARSCENASPVQKTMAGWCR